jgi:histidinol-phosphate aminotransferase
MVMQQQTNRRQWIRQTTVTLGGLAIAPHLMAGSRTIERPVSTIIRLNANENPYGPSSLASKAMQAAVQSSNCYPWEVTTQLREKIAALHGLTKENILMGAGSSEILGITAQLAGLRKGNAVTADPTFGIWFTSAQHAGLEIIKVPLDANKKHDLQRMKERINDQTRLVYICNPNNPTGTIVSSSELQQFITGISSYIIILLDEAYIEYSQEPSLVSLVKTLPNLIIAKTFSKIYGLAGARIGYGIANDKLITRLNEMQPWANAGASTVSLAGALASMDDAAFVHSSKTKNAAAKNLVTNYFNEAGISFIPSHTNFLYYSLQQQKTDFLAALAAANIRGGRITEENGKWSRISIGTMNDMQQFLQVVKQSF